MMLRFISAMCLTLSWFAGCALLGGPAQGPLMHPCRQAQTPGATKECTDNYDCPPYSNPSGPCEWVGPDILSARRRDAGTKDGSR
jgi:hypothetical protein